MDERPAPGYHRILTNSMVEITLLEAENYLMLPERIFGLARSMIRASLIVSRYPVTGITPTFERIIAEIAVGCTLAGFEEAKERIKNGRGLDS